MTLTLDIEHALYFLDKLDPKERHTIASEAPFGRNGLPKWEGGATYEARQRDLLINDIKERQERKSNVYYSVNRPCEVIKRQGMYGKNNIDDIICIRALAFDIDVLQPQEIVLETINKNLDGDFIPSLVIFTGGGYHLIYLFKNQINIELSRPPKNDIEQRKNEDKIFIRGTVTQLAKNFEHLLRTKFPSWKVDNMSNVDRVMRLPGTVNYPKLEKQAKGQIPALSKIVLENYNRIELHTLLSQVPRLSEQHSQLHAKIPFNPPKDYKWTAYAKAKACCEFIRDNGLADSNEWYTFNVMLPLIGAIHEENEHSKVTIEEAEELFMIAISGGGRYNTMGRGPRYFARQWKSHRPEIKRNGTKSLGGLIWAASENGMQLPWKDQVPWEEDFQRQLKEMSEQVQIISPQVSRQLSDE
jgi:hypothetical protein